MNRPLKRRQKDKKTKPPSAFKKWYRGHYRAAKEGLKIPLHNPYRSLFTVLTLAICFYLPLLIWNLWQNFDQLEQQWQNKGSMAVFLKPQSDRQQTLAVKQDIDGYAMVKSSQIIEQQQIKQQLSKDPQLNKVMAMINDQDLPDQIIITANPQATNQQLLTLSQQLQQHSQIDYVSFDQEWSKQLTAISLALYYLMQACILIFLIIVTVFLSNSIANEVANNKKEIALNKLLGATASQNRRRFLYSGIYYGLLASIIAVTLLQITQWWLQKPIAQLSAGFGHGIQITAPNALQLLLFTLIATTIVWLTTRLIATRHISSV